VEKIYGGKFTEKIYGENLREKIYGRKFTEKIYGENLIGRTPMEMYEQAA